VTIRLGAVESGTRLDHLIGGFQLSQRDRTDMIVFLQSLTDDTVLHDPRFANPW
jgi:hypothetical protein